LEREKIRKEPLSIKKIFTAPSTFNKREQKRGLSEKRDGNCHVLAGSPWEMLLKAVEQPLGTAKRV
jgi:hypothetical protein